MTQTEAPEAVDPRVQLRVEDGIAYLCVDVLEDKVNTLSTPMVERFEAILAQLRQGSPLEGVVLHSGKPDGFIAGFDIKELRERRGDPGRLAQLVQRGHALMSALEALDAPVVAAIHGPCLGGGLEVALACAGRVATDDPKTRLGLPEVMLGVIPGGGGTQRLTRLIDPQAALDMILSGGQKTARQALKLGLVDELVHPGVLLKTAAARARALRATRQAQDSGRAGRALHELQDTLHEALRSPLPQALRLVSKTPARRLLFEKARQQVMDKTKGHYPAPLKALEVMELGLAQGFEAGLRAEAAAFVELVQTPQAGHLMGLFMMQSELSKDPVVSAQVRPKPVRRLGVLGAGLMGAGIAQLAASRGYVVRLKDHDLQGLGRGLSTCRGLFDKQVKRRKLSAAEADVAMGRINAGLELEALAGVELVIEAIPEDLALKQALLRSLEAISREDQIVASNTSTLPIAQIAAYSARPERVLGMHFFSPVHKMPLLEIIRAPQTCDEAIATALAVGRALGKTCIVVADGPGFFTSRVIGAYINEAGWILQEGGRIEDIDQAMERFGFPVGPLKLVDEVGIDVGVKAGEVLKRAFEQRWDAPSGLEVIVQDGRKGRKNGRGFYGYGDQSRGPDVSVYDLLPGGQDRRTFPEHEIASRCWLAMLNECAWCLHEGIVQTPRDIDLGVIFGLGFPPHRGGALRHADALGLERVVQDMERLADRYGERLRPAPNLAQLARQRATFYGSASGSLTCPGGPA